MQYGWQVPPAWEGSLGDLNCNATSPGHTHDLHSAGTNLQKKIFNILYALAFWHIDMSQNSDYNNKQRIDIVSQ